MRSQLTTVSGFLVLFGLYHGAEAMIVYQNNPVGFLTLQALFFVAAWFIARLQARRGFSAWGLDLRKGWGIQLLMGMAMGLLLYGLTFAISLAIGAERLESMPSLSSVMQPLGLFVFGNLFSSLSEDVLTRGYVWRHAEGKIPAAALIVLSALLYLLNHIYRLADGPRAWVYLFALGLLYVLPLVRTRRLWFTGGMHWAGNSLFFYTHELSAAKEGTLSLSPNYVLAVVALALIPLNLWITRRWRTDHQAQLLVSAKTR